MTALRSASRRDPGEALPRQRLIEVLRAQGIADERVLAVIGRIPREVYVDDAFRGRAYENSALPIGHQQTISQPWMVARMTEALLAAGPRKRVLEVGTGSGYQTAVLAALVEIVFTVERLRALSESARARLAGQGYRNVHCGYADGMQGWAPYAPFDGILVTAASLELPAALAAQLAVGGRLVVPLGAPGAQQLKLFERSSKGLVETTLAAVSFVPLLAGKA